MTAGDANAKKFKITLTGGADYSHSKLSSSSSAITNLEGVIESYQTVSKEGLSRINDANTYKLDQQFLDLRAEYNFLKGMSAWLGVGVVTTSMKNAYNAEDIIYTKSASENPTFLLKGGLCYRFDFKGGWFVEIKPGVAWNRSNNNLMSFAQNDDSAIYHNYALKRDILRWAVPLTIGRKIDKWQPYVGVSYRDYLLRDKFETTIPYIGTNYPIEIRDHYRMKDKVHGVVGCSYAIYEYLGLNLNLNFSRRCAGSLSLYFNI